MKKKMRVLEKPKNTRIARVFKCENFPGLDRGVSIEMFVYRNIDEFVADCVNRGASGIRKTGPNEANSKLLIMEKSIMIPGQVNIQVLAHHSANPLDLSVVVAGSVINYSIRTIFGDKDVPAQFPFQAVLTGFQPRLVQTILSWWSHEMVGGN